jgi:hypothetical protein
LYSQNTDSSKAETENYFRYTYDNDFFSATDRYYTQGVRLELILKALKHNPLSYLLLPVNRSSRKYYGLAFERDGFTPRSIRKDSIYLNERPYAGISYLSSFLISLDGKENQKLSNYIDLGIIGPNSLGAEEQKFIHKKLDNIQPLGWEYQIANDIIINYKLRYEKGIIDHKNVEVVGSLEARLGTLYDDLSVGSMIRLGRFQKYFENLGTSKYSSDKKFQCYVTLHGALKGVAYNASMQGGMLNRSSVYILRADQINRIVGTGSAGIVLAYKRVSVEYTKVYISKEIYSGLDHGWGHCYITVAF